MLEMIKSDELKLISRDILDCPQYFKKRVNKLLDEYEEDNSRTAGLSRIITVKVGAKIMLRRNIDITLGLVNGAIGEIIGFSQASNANDFENIQIRLLTGDVHSLESNTSKFQLMDKAYVVRNQFPISLSYGITIHKSQGLSLKTVIVDAGNTVFTCGQIYVALSRVTSLKGLHLINFDPSSVQANKLAILEYNRLRSNYRPDLTIIKCQIERRDKVYDTRWTLFPKTTNYPETTNAYNSVIEIHTIKAFINTDYVSAYANATIQCMLNCQLIRQIILNRHNSDAMKILADAYVNKELLNFFTIRQHLGGTFIENIPQDSSEFLLNLINDQDDIRAVLEHEFIHKVCCKTCNQTISNKEKNVILTVPLCVLEGKSSDQQDIIQKTYSQWHVLDESCIHCGSNERLFKTDVTMAGNVILLQLLPFQKRNDNITKIPKFCIKSVPTAKIHIAQKIYRVICAIFYDGDINKSGHYTCFVRDKNSSFISINDERILRKQWPRGAKDAYLFFLEEINK